MVHKQTKAELQQHLEEQIVFLKSSCEAYDDGNSAEAKRIAHIARILMHDTSSSHSLLQQLGLKNGQFLSTCATKFKNDGVETSFKGLISVFLGDGSTDFYVPLDRAHEKKHLDFNDWWDEIILIDQGQREFSRKDIVLAVSNKDGGAHIDPELPTSYADLSKNNSLGNLTSQGKGWLPMQNPELATLRQIGHEILKSLDEGYEKQPAHRGDGFVVGGVQFHMKSSSTQPRVQRKIGRNEPCPCGKGKKYKKCCGRP